ncbi:MAG: hypothetical protein QHJ73_13645 [Armatimonadota bacterium]|nr:hypothetical protein [Armatimonadota bacterium]
MNVRPDERRSDDRVRQSLYARAEEAARAFFAEHFGDVCACCYRASELRGDPSFCCCRRTNFVPEVTVDPLLGALAEESMGRTLLHLYGMPRRDGCAALGPTGCLIPFGRPDACNTYVCDHLYRCMAAVLPPELILRLGEALDVFTTLRTPAGVPTHALAAGVEALVELLREASENLQRAKGTFTRQKAEVMAEMLPPGVEPPAPP